MTSCFSVFFSFGLLEGFGCWFYFFGFALLFAGVVLWGLVFGFVFIWGGGGALFVGVL